MKTYPLKSFSDFFWSPLNLSRTTEWVRHIFPLPGSEFWQRDGELQRNLDLILGAIDSSWRFRQLTAEVIDIIQETPNTRSFILRPGAFWQGFVAGQYIPVYLEIDGVLVRRFYSLSSSEQTFEHQGLIGITVREHEQGRLSPQLHRQLYKGSVVRIGQACGQFVLPDYSASLGSDQTLPQKLLMIAAGSGITPMLSMLQSLAGNLPPGFDNCTDKIPSVTLIYYVRTEQDVIAMQRLATLKSTMPGLTVRIHLTSTEGRVSVSQLQNDCLDISSRCLYLCGPEGFMDTVVAHVQALGMERSAIRLESFGAGSVTKSAISTDALAAMKEGRQEASGVVRFTRSGTEALSAGQNTLLELAELAGLKPKHGCRAGICHECTCSTSGGRVVNRLTGELVPEEQQQVQACISIPLGDLAVSNW